MKRRVGETEIFGRRQAAVRTNERRRPQSRDRPERQGRERPKQIAKRVANLVKDLERSVATSNSQVLYFFFCEGAFRHGRPAQPFAIRSRILPQMMLPVDPVEFAPAVGGQWTDKRMVDDVDAAAELTFTFSRVSESILCNSWPIPACASSANIPFGMARSGDFRPLRQIPEFQNQQRCEPVVQCRPRCRWSALLQALREPATRVLVG